MCIIDTQFSVVPGPPVNVREKGVTNTTIKLIWLPPSELGTPTVSYYCIVMYYTLPLMSKHY